MPFPIVPTFKEIDPSKLPAVDQVGHNRREQGEDLKLEAAKIQLKSVELDNQITSLKLHQEELAPVKFAYNQISKFIDDAASKGDYETASMFEDDLLPLSSELGIKHIRRDWRTIGKNFVSAKEALDNQNAIGVVNQQIMMQDAVSMPTRESRAKVAEAAAKNVYNRLYSIDKSEDPKPFIDEYEPYTSTDSKAWEEYFTRNPEKANVIAKKLGLLSFDVDAYVDKSRGEKKSQEFITLIRAAEDNPEVRAKLMEQNPDIDPYINFLNTYRDNTREDRYFIQKQKMREAQRKDEMEYQIKKIDEKIKNTAEFGGLFDSISLGLATDIRNKQGALALSVVSVVKNKDSTDRISNTDKARLFTLYRETAFNDEELEGRENESRYMEDVANSIRITGGLVLTPDGLERFEKAKSKNAFAHKIAPTILQPYIKEDEALRSRLVNILLYSKHNRKRSFDKETGELKLGPPRMSPYYLEYIRLLDPINERAGYGTPDFRINMLYIINGMTIPKKNKVLPHQFWGKAKS